MNQDGFAIAKQLESEGWEFAYDRDGKMVFNRNFFGTIYTVAITGG